MTSAELIKAVKDTPSPKFETIRNAFAALWPKTKDGELPSSGSIGNMFQSIRDKPFGDKRFRLAGEHNRAKLWKVESIQGGKKPHESRESNQSLAGVTRENIPTTDVIRTDVKRDELPSHDGKQTHQTHQTHNTHCGGFPPFDPPGTEDLRKPLTAGMSLGFRRKSQANGGRLYEEFLRQD